MRLMVACAAAVLLTLAGAYGASYEPPSVADEPQADTTSALISAAVTGCVEAGREVAVEVTGSTYWVRCAALPDLGVGPQIARRIVR